MPIYEYQCKDCGENFEALQKITAMPLTECRFCSGKIEKLVSNSSFTFKGGGWYITDYKNKSKKNKAGTKNTKTVNKKPSKNNDNNQNNKTDIKPANTEQKKVS